VTEDSQSNEFNELKHIDDFARELLSVSVQERFTEKGMDQLVKKLRKFAFLSQDFTQRRMREKYPSLEEEVVNFACQNNLLGK
jgi:hypothetical protein